MGQNYDEAMAQLEEADAELASALSKRAAAVKTANQIRRDSPDAYFGKIGDEDCIRRVIEGVEGFPDVGVRAIVREVLSASHALVEDRRVVVVGGRWSFAHVAARSHFGTSTSYGTSPTVRVALDELARDGASYVVLPLETSTDGAVTATLTGLVQSEAHICAEVTVAVVHHLWSSSGERAKVDRIYGTRASLAAAEAFVRREFPGATLHDTALGSVAADFAREDEKAAVIGPEVLTEDGLQVVVEGIDDERGLSTRFAIVGKTLPSRTGRDRTVIAMAVGDTPGALYETLRPFAERGINLTRLESRPANGTAWRYLFFLEMDGHVTDRPILTGLQELRGVSRHVRILGSYPRPAPRGE
jgi:chorismate mutase/prephenate dehydratase